MMVAACANAFSAKRRLQLLQLRIETIDGLPHIQAEIGRHLVVARTGRMQPSGGGADELLEPRFDIEVDVLQRPRKDEGARLNLRLHLIEASPDFIRIGFRDDALVCEHGGMGLGARDVLCKKALVEIRSRR